MELLYLIPYFLIPFLVGNGIEKIFRGYLFLTYGLTAIGLFFYPAIVFLIQDYINPPLNPSGGQCLNPMMALMVVHVFILIPCSLILQFAINKHLIQKRKANGDQSSVVLQIKE